MRRARRKPAGTLRESADLYGSGRSAVSSQGQVTIPKALRERYGLTPGTEVHFEPTEGGVLLHRRQPGRHPVWQAIGSLRTRWRWPKGVARTVDAYIDEVRGGSYEELTGKKPKLRRTK